MPVHIFGQPSHIDEINKIAKKHNLFVIEDCAEALGAKYKNKIIGQHSDASCFSFFANKLITTGEGGIVVFKNKKNLEKSKIIRNQGMNPKKKYWHNYIGSNYRITNLQAAIGVAQLDKIEYFLLKRKKTFETYDNYLFGNDKLSLYPRNDWSTNSYWLYTILLNNFGKRKRDSIIKD